MRTRKRGGEAGLEPRPGQAAGGGDVWVGSSVEASPAIEEKRDPPRSGVRQDESEIPERRDRHNTYRSGHVKYTTDRDTSGYKSRAPCGPPAGKSTSAVLWPARKRRRSLFLPSTKGTSSPGEQYVLVMESRRPQAGDGTVHFSDSFMTHSSDVRDNFISR